MFKLRMFAAAACCCFVGITSSTSSAATITHGIGVDNQTTSNASFIASWAAAGVDGTTSSVTTSPIAATVGGQAFTYEITVAYTGSGGAENLSLIAPNSLLGAGGVQLDELSDEVTISVNVLTNASLVSFDGFSQFSVGNFTQTGASAENVDVNGTSYGGGLVFPLAPNEPGFVLAPLNNDSGSSSTLTVRYVDFQFSNAASAPEPSSMLLALFGLPGIGVARRQAQRK